MTLSLTIDKKLWFKHLQQEISDFSANNISLVPVIKGNGYGIGRNRLAKVCEELKISTIAVGTVYEINEVIDANFKNILIMDPIESQDIDSYKEYEKFDKNKTTLTVSSLKNINKFIDSALVIEGLTSMNRFGLNKSDLNQVKSHKIQGLSLHLPIDSTNKSKLSEVRSWLKAYQEHCTNGAKVVWLSHLSNKDLKGLALEFPAFEFNLRMGTKFWLGNQKAFKIESTVLEVHEPMSGTFGYRQRKIDDNHRLLVVSGGTAHGVGLQAPRSNTSLKQRVTAALVGILEAFNLSLSPFVIKGKQRWFAEPPHMNVSMLKISKKISSPIVGEKIVVQLRMTTTNFDSVNIN